MVNITDNTRQIIIRNATVKFGSANYGLVNEVKLTIKKIEAGKDSLMRSVPAGYLVSAEWRVLQSDNETMYNLINSAASDGFSTLYILHSNGNNSFILDNVLPVPDFEIDGSGKVSGLKMTAERALTTTELAGILYNSSVLTVDDTQNYDGAALTLSQPIYFYMRPRLVYCPSVNRTYMTFSRGRAGTSEMQTNYLLYYDHSTQTFSSVVNIGPNKTGNDGHHIAALFVTSDGYILTAYDPLSTDGQSHNYGILIQRSENPHDIEAMDSMGMIQKDGTTDYGSYPWFAELPNGEIVVGYRLAYGAPSGPHYGVEMSRSSDGGITWCNAYRICQINDNDDFWAYNFCAIGARGTDLRVIVHPYDDGTPNTNTSLFVFRSRDGIIWSNEQQTFTKNVLEDGFFLSDESQTHCLISSSSSTLVFCRSAVVSRSNKLYLVWSDGSTTVHTQRFTFCDGINWVHRTLPTNIFNGGNSAHCALVVYDDLTFDLFAIDNNGGATTYHILKRWRTQNKGETWTLLETLINDSVNYKFAYMLTNTFQDVNKLIFAAENRIAADNIHDVYFRVYTKP